MNLLTIENGELRLNSNLDEYTFGKSSHDNILSYEGAIFDGSNFRQWTFEEVKSYQAEKNGSPEHLVFYCAKNPLGSGARTLADLLEEGGTSALAAATTVCAALSSAAKNGNTLPAVGAGGILVDGDKLLFAPEALFSYAANTLSAEEGLKLQTGYLNETLKELPLLCFERACLAYRLLTGSLPFTAGDSIARCSDIFDHKFLPIEYCVEGIDPYLARAINNALMLNSTAINVPGKRKKGKASEDLKPQADFPLEKLAQAFEQAQLQAKNGPSATFTEKVTAFKKSQNSKINTKRNIKRNTTTITVIAAIVITAIVITVNTIRSRGEDYTSTGLTSTQTIRAWANGINEKDTMLLSEFSSGKAAGNINDMVSRMYVLHKQRMAYGNDNGFATPASWLFYIHDDSSYDRSGVYGLTNLKIDGKEESLKVELKKKKEKPAPLEKEGSVTLQEGSTSVHKLDYYIISTDGTDVDYIVEKSTATITLTFKKGRWIITDVELKSKDLKVDCQTFKADYFEALASSEGQVIPAVKTLRTKYPWLPETEALEREEERINYQMEHPFGEFGL